MSDPPASTHPPGCECPDHSFVEPPGLAVDRLHRQVESLVGTLSPTEQAILRVRLEHADSSPEVRRAAMRTALAALKAGG